MLAHQSRAFNSTSGPAVGAMGSTSGGISTAPGSIGSTGPLGGGSGGALGGHDCSTLSSISMRLGRASAVSAGPLCSPPTLVRSVPQAASAATVRRMRARYRSEGLWGLVDGRAVRQRSALGRADERVVAAVRKVLEGQRERSTGTLVRLRRRVGWLLEEEYGARAVALPPASTFNRLVHAVADGQGLLGTAAQRRWHASRPAPPFTPTVALRPGELVMLDSTPLDVLAVLDDGVTGRLELCIALDVATRSICAAVVRPVGTTSVDAAMLLAQMVVPTAMRPGWDAALSKQRSVIPYERLIALDARLEQAAARPVIMPETVIVDQGRVYVSASFVSACESLGVSVQPVPPANGPAKGNVERTFRAIADGFSQYLPGHTGSYVSQRGAAAEQDACWSLAQLQALLDEWVICGWQERRHEALRHPMMPRVAVSPNEMWAALVAVTGHVPVPLSADDYVELLPVRWQAVNDYGIRFGYRTYDHPGLNPHRRRRSPRADQNGRWEVQPQPLRPEPGVGTPARGMARGAVGPRGGGTAPVHRVHLRPRPPHPGTPREPRRTRGGDRPHRRRGQRLRPRPTPPPTPSHRRLGQRPRPGRRRP
ncbi:hypothetical protein ACFYOV_33195 [Streptomyces sp. NPDC005931]|uniref:hypothetical protein n=1 Tax=Streptomyces sp. NPDC005931 TaxID=3364737 RepID=UPI0036C506C1